MVSDYGSVTEAKVLCPLCGRALEWAALLGHLVACLGLKPGDRALVGPIIVTVTSTVRAGATTKLADAIAFDPDLYRLNVAATSFEVTPRLAHLLTFLVRNARITLTRRQIIEGAWGIDPDVLDREVDSYVARLRALLDHHPGGRALIVTVRGVGYRLEPSR